MTILIAGLNACQNNNSSTDSAASELLKDTVIDIDNNVYHTFKMGTQIWMVENLKTTHYRNGEAIPNVIDTAGYSRLTTGAYSNYNNDTNIVETSGRLYNWYAVSDKRLIAPKGWHVPSKEEWKILLEYINEHELPFEKTDSSGWKNGPGFSSVPSGKRLPDGSFINIKQASYWTLTIGNNDRIIVVENEKANVSMKEESKGAGLSVRCIKDN